MSRVVEIEDLGQIRYADASALQDALVGARQRDEIPDRLLLLEHPPVITYGRRAGTQHLLASPALVTRQGVELCATDRGGDITFHGPGQLVGYLIVKLEGAERSVPRLFSTLERAICAALARYGVDAEGGTGGAQRAGAEDGGVHLGRAGVWIGTDKICAIGMKLSSWVTKHGFALNVDVKDEYFQMITPCGLSDAGVVSMAQICAQTPPLAALKQALAEEFASAFERNPRWR